MPAEKFIHKVSPTLTDDAQYKAITDIPAADRTQGSTVLIYPGSYDALTGAWDNISFRGVGDKDEVVINGVNLSNTSANLITFENLTIRGSNLVVNSNTQAVLINAAAATVQLEFWHCKLSNAEFAVRNYGSGTTKFYYTDSSGCDKGLNVASGAASVSFSILGANAYFTPANAFQATVTTIASYAGTGNVGNTVETVRSLIS